ncbi:MAG: flippase [Lachnospiraceae bacterium]
MQQTSIKKNFIMNSILTMSSFIFPLISYPYVSRILGPAGTGKVAAATSWVSYFNMFAQLGIPTYGIRACAEVRDDKEKLSRTVQELLTINLIMGAISYAALFVLININSSMGQEKPLYIIMSAMILFNAIGMDYLFQGLEQYSYITKRSVLFKLIALVAMFLLIRTKDDYVIYGGLTIFASSASNVMNFFYARKYISFKKTGKLNLRRHLKAVSIFFAMACATTVYTNLDVVMLDYLKTDEDVGYYNAAVKIKSVLVSIVTSLGSVLLPRASYYVEKGMKAEYRRITAKAINFVWLFAAPLFIYFTLFAREGVLFLSGSAYEGSVAPMQIIMPTLLLIGLSNITGMEVLVPQGGEKIVLYSEIAGAVVDFTLNMLLIPKMASSGAAIGTVTAEAVVLIVQYACVRNQVREQFREVRYGTLLMALAAGAAASCWVRLLPLDSLAFQMQNFLILIISAVCFFGAYLAVLLLRKEPLAREITGQVLHRIRRK